ncbi:MAG: lysophospholipid acyltransferase family protein [Pseudomonadota bacterium]
MPHLRSLLFLIVLVVLSAVWCVLLPLMALFSRSTRYKTVVLWARLVLGALHRLCGLTFVVEGRENIPDTASIAYIKHTTVWETIADIVVFPEQSWVLKRELMWVPLLGLGLYMLAPIAINRNARHSAAQQVIAQGKQRLRDGVWLMIFPEGTRVEPGKTRRYGFSGAVLAAKSGVPIVPVAHNAGDYWPKGEFVKRPGTIRFCIGPAIDPSDKSAQQINAEAQQWIEGKMAQIGAGYERPVDAVASATDAGL